MRRECLAQAKHSLLLFIGTSLNQGIENVMGMIVIRLIVIKLRMELHAKQEFMLWCVHNFHIAILTHSTHHKARGEIFDVLMVESVDHNAIFANQFMEIGVFQHL